MTRPTDRLRRPTLTLTEAVTRYVADGDCVYLGNFGAQLFSVGHELIRQRRRSLHAVVASGGLLLDQLIGAGVLAAATFGHCWSPVGPDPAWNFRRLVESGDSSVALHEVSLAMLNAALTAAAWRVPFMPVPSTPGTGYTDSGWSGGLLGTADGDFGPATVVRAVTPDVAFVHADLVDERGNAVIRTPLGEVPAASQAARRVVVVAEAAASVEQVRAAGATLPGLLVTAAVVAPGAVHPDGAPGRYPRDVAAYQAYVAAARTSEGFARWLADEVAVPR